MAKLRLSALEEVVGIMRAAEASQRLKLGATRPRREDREAWIAGEVVGMFRSGWYDGIPRSAITDRAVLSGEGGATDQVLEWLRECGVRVVDDRAARKKERVEKRKEVKRLRMEEVVGRRYTGLDALRAARTVVGRWDEAADLAGRLLGAEQGLGAQRWWTEREARKAVQAYAQSLRSGG